MAAKLCTQLHNAVALIAQLRIKIRGCPHQWKIVKQDTFVGLIYDLNNPPKQTYGKQESRRCTVCGLLQRRISLNPDRPMMEWFNENIKD